MIAELRIAELLCTRLCHDLTGPIGAISNGAELLAEDGFSLHDKAIELIGTSANQAVSRLQFYRRAYGRINDDGEANLAELKELVINFFSGTRNIVNWADIYTDASGVSVSYKMAKLLLNLLIITSSTLLIGGNISVRIYETDKAKEISVKAEGAKIKWSPEIEQVLAGSVTIESLTPKTVQAELTRLLADEINTKLLWNINEQSVEIIASRQIIEGI